MARKPKNTDLQAAVDNDIAAPDTKPHTNGVKRLDLDADEADDDGDEDDGTYAATVDGDDALIDTRTAPEQTEVERPSFQQLMRAISESARQLERDTLALTAAKAKHKLSQMGHDGLVAQLRTTWEESHQLELGLTIPQRICDNCGLHESVIPLNSGERWCVPCVQSVVEPQGVPVEAEREMVPA
jgi:hypothetical protein